MADNTHRMNEAAMEAGLRKAALQGDASAWRALYDSAHAKIARYALWRCGRHDLAEEVIQETWLTAARTLKRFDPARGRFESWLFTLAAKSVTAHLVKTARQRMRVTALAAAAEPMIPEAAEDRDAERVARALATLNDAKETVLRQKYFEEMTVAEIAAANAVSEKAVESWLTRARDAFRTAYEALGD